ncbi:hypothetical protein [Erythrobacter dokdonensis]|uniref:Uncharacterized protein n=1 Tax=Erythrobacter dokdonensis DSW-74 TaxID=1300349 RepID=A0A1A7BEE1_9SPHN|nr:hypothetical protein [Erythrobacter dokdonensis]OBV10849.1 hypothetical protein I603_2062 [Erythrobacter dokdonensis DSW-74]
MIALSRRRPTSITVFAVAFLGSALLVFAEALLNIPDRLSYLAKLMPAVDWSRDAVIVWQSMWLSIALIPIAMVWLSAVRFARWMVTIMAALKLLGVLLVAMKSWRMIEMIGPAQLASLLLTVLAVALLFTPASNHWFKDRGGTDPAVFE